MGVNPAWARDRLLRPARTQWPWCLLYFALAASIFQFPAYPEQSLDGAWRMVLTHALSHGWQFGRDIVFTYGPLGAFLGNTDAGEGIALLLAWQAAFALALSGLIVHLARRAVGWRRAVFVAFWPLVPVREPNALHPLAILLIGMTLAHRREGASRALGFAGLCALAVLAAIKFNHLLLAGGIVAALALRRARQARRLRAALEPILGFVAAFLLVWELGGQRLSSLLPYLRNSLQVAGGYVDNMGLVAPSELLREALTACALLALWLIHELRRHPDRIEALFDAAILGAFSFAAWKHGFVRADGHTGAFFIAALGAGVVVLLFYSRWPSASRLAPLFLGALAFVCLEGIEDTWPGSARGMLGELEAKLWRNGERFALGRGIVDFYASELEARRAEADLPRVRAVVGDATLDVFGHEQAVAILNRFNYRPRPVFQGYSAYTPELARLNQEFYASDRAPEFVLFKAQTIDGRVPAMDDSLALREVLGRYEPVLSEGGFTLLRRSPGSPEVLSLGDGEQRRVPLGAPIDLVRLPVGSTWIELEAPLSLLGALRSALLRPPLAHLDVVFHHGRALTFRLPLAQARTGFLVNPPGSPEAWYSDRMAVWPSGRVYRLRVSVDPDDRAFFRGDVLVTQRRGRPATQVTSVAPRFGGGVDPGAPAPFEAWRSLPEEYAAHALAAGARIEGQPVVLLHAPSVASLVVPPGSRLVRGSLGYLPEAYEGEGRTDGAGFRIVWWHGGHREGLFERFLDPLRVASDRGLIPFAVPFDGSAGGAIDLEVDPGPRGDNAWDWTAWTGAEVL